MYLTRKTSQHRRDFNAKMACEFCDAPEVDLEGGYDDEYYHSTVIPSIVCASCGHAGNEKADGPRSHPDVPEGVVM